MAKPVSPKPNRHVFGKPRPSASGTHPIHLAPPRNTSFRDLPPPTGTAPFRLDLKSILPAADYAAIVAKKKLTFHFNGDMGGINYNVPQLAVAKAMEQDIVAGADPSENPAFLYIAGDCVYFNGEVAQYYTQFYQPYEFYPGPILAVPGNHDGENLPGENTLDGFIRNFCAASPIRTPESGDSQRTAMIQPNVYWTLLTPFANFVGLYSNVPEGGDIRSPQTEWYQNELKTLPTNVPLIVTLHHPIYSADDHHSGSTYMKNFLEQASQATGRVPELVIAGHVHDYQRLTRNPAGGEQFLYLVTGAGGYHNLHTIMLVNGQKMIPPVVFNDKQGDPVTLERYVDNTHGFLRMEITPQLVTGKYYTIPGPNDPPTQPTQLADYFEFDWKARKYVPNTLKP